MAVFTIGNI